MEIAAARQQGKYLCDRPDQAMVAAAAEWAACCIILFLLLFSVGRLTSTTIGEK
jgi:hypothetical protein